MLVTATNLTAPTSAPGLNKLSGSTPFHAGTFSVAYTFFSAAGETAASPSANITITAGQVVQVSSIVNVPSWVTAVNFYFTATPSGDTIGFVTNAIPAGGSTPVTNLTVEGNGGGPPGSTPGNIWVVTRGAENTVQASHTVGAQVVANLTAGALSAAFARIDQGDNTTQTMHGNLVVTSGIALPFQQGGAVLNNVFGTVPSRFATQTPGSTNAFTQQIPNWVRSLQIIWRARDTSANTVGSFVNVIANGDTTGSYFGNNFGGNSVASSTQLNFQTSMLLAITQGGGQTAGVVSSGVINCSFIGVGGAHPTFCSTNHQDNGAGSGTNGQITNLLTWHWSNNGPVTSLTFTCGAANFSQPETVFDFYGWP